MSISAIIFDMDGLMFDTEKIGLEAFQKAALQYGYVDTQGTFLRMIGRNVRDADRILLEDFGADFPVTAVRTERLSLLEAMRRENGIPMKDGLMDILHFLKNRGMDLAVASSSDRSVVMQNISAHTLEQYFAVVVCGDEVTVGKPDPEIFLKAAHKLGVLPSECLVLEDADAGIRAAHAAGMTPLLIPDILEPSDDIRALAYATLKSLKDVPEIIDQMQQE